MKLLVLGGTKFLGRHIVEQALDRGHEVTLFHRGQTHPGLFPQAESILGDRDGQLDRLGDRVWDSVIDTSGYVPAFSPFRSPGPRTPYSVLYVCLNNIGLRRLFCFRGG